MTWKKLHHAYIGYFFGMASFAWAGVEFARHDLQRAVIAVILGVAFELYGLDDLLFHWKGWKTPFWWIEQGLRKIEIYRTISDWLNKLFQGGKDV